MQQRQRHTSPPEDEAIVDMPEPVEASDRAETDRLLDEIDAVLEDVDADAETEQRRAFRDKLRSISFGRRREQQPPPCAGCGGVLITVKRTRDGDGR